MGWSCASKTAFRLDAISAACVAQTGQSNVFIMNGTRFFFETSHREHSDGAITGTIHRFINETQCLKAGSFRIEGDGTMKRGPAFMKNAPAFTINIDGLESFYTPHHGPTPPTNDTLTNYIKTEHMKQYMEGGINRHVAIARGIMPYPSRAFVTNLKTGRTAAEWKAAMFETW